MRPRIEIGRAWLPPALAFALPLAAYLLTAAPSLTFRNGGADAGDLVVAIYTLGVPHPTGYPLYVLVAQLFLRLPFPEVAFRINVMSAVLASVAVALVYAAAHTLIVRNPAVGPARARWAALAGALVLAFSPFFWSQATVAEVYTLTATLAAALLLATVSLRSAGSRRAARQRLVLIGLLGGLGLASHATLVFLLALPLAAALSLRLLAPRTALALAAAGLVGLLPLLYLPLRTGQSPTGWGDASTLEGFIALVTASQYRALVGGVPREAIATRLALLLPMLAQQLAWIGLPLAIAGGARLFRRDPWLVATSGGIVVGYAVFASAYSGINSEVYLIPALMLLALGMAVALAEPLALLGVLGRAPRWFLLIPALACLASWPLVDVSRDRQMEADGRAVLRLAPPQAVILTAADEDTFALWYLRYVVGLRPDVVVVDQRLAEWPWYRANLRRFERLDLPSSTFGDRPVVFARHGTVTRQ